MASEPSLSPYISGNGYRTSFASVSLHKTDRIRLLHFPQGDVAAIRSAILRDWPRGFQDESTDGQTHEFKCSGNPWSGQGKDSVRARVLMRGLLAQLFALGWILTASTDVSKCVDGKDTMIFRKQAPPPPASEWVAISFNNGDRLRLIGAPDRLVAAFKALLMAMGLCQDALWKDVALNAFEIKIRGWPWGQPGGNIFLRMLETLEAGGWSLYACVNHDNGFQSRYSCLTGADSWYCVRAVDWVPGNAVFHR